MILRQWIADEARSTGRGFLGAWAALTLAAPLGYVVFVGAIGVFARVRTGTWEGFFPIQLYAAGFVAFVFCLALGPVFLVFRRLIVGPRFPFVRWGYLVVPSVGLIATCYIDPHAPQQPVELVGLFLVFFQVPALIGTLIYVALARWWGGFANEAPRAPRHDGSSPCR